MKSMIYVEDCDDLQLIGNFSNNEAPLLIAKKTKKITARNNISNSNSIPYEVEDCGELIAENNRDLKTQKKQVVSKSDTTPHFKVSIVYMLVMRAIYGKQ
ncbi:TPA: hypothetical protein RN777_004149 [Escherichia coli]|nr:hypothetical protein [Escherichia coli]HDX1826336.1 hypothetical protein [Escherichia coli]